MRDRACETRLRPARDQASVRCGAGLHVMTNIVGCSPSDVRVGVPAAVARGPLNDGRSLRPHAPAAGGVAPAAEAT